MSFAKKVEFANYTCKFGEDINLLDMFDEVVWPSFDDHGHLRKFKGVEFFFIDTCLINIGTDSDVVMALAGKIVKNTKLKRDQIYRTGKGIVEDHDELETAPTSIFVLILDTHRLLYMREVSGAPDIKAFRATSQKFLKESHKQFIEQKYRSNEIESQGNNEVKKITKKELVQNYPYPELRITTLTDPTSLRSYVDHFKKIEELVITLLPTNNEDIDNDDYWNYLSQTRNKMDSKNVTTKFANKTDGLESTEVYEQSTSATELANSEVKIKGEDYSGGEVRGNNEDFRLMVNMGDISKNVEFASKHLFTEFLQQIVSGNISAPKISKAVADKVSNIAGRFL